MRVSKFDRRICRFLLDGTQLKSRHAAPVRLAVLMALPMPLLGAMPYRGVQSFSAWNYWYALFLPVALSLVVACVAQADARTRMRGLLGLGFPLGSAWWAKALWCLALCALSNFVVFGIYLAGSAFSSQGLTIAGTLTMLLCALANTLTAAWMVPAGLFLTARLGMLAGIFCPLAVQLVGGFAWSIVPLPQLFPPSASMVIPTSFIPVLPSGEPLAADMALGGALAADGDDIRTKVAVISANSGKYPVAAQCRILGVPRATYYWMLSHPEREPEPDPIAGDVIEAFEAGRREYGAPRLKRELAKRGIVASRRRITRIMRENGLVSSFAGPGFKPHPGKANDADVPNELDRGFDGHAPHTHIVSDLTYVRVGRRWNYVCLLIDLYNREIVGHSCGERKDADLVKAAFATLEFPLFDIEVFHTDRGSEFDNRAIDELLEVFGIRRSLSRKGNPYDNAVNESTNKTLKVASIYQRRFATLGELRDELNSYVRWYNNERMHSKLGYMSPVEFREAGLSL